MIKPSEFAPRTSELMAELFGMAFAETEVAVVSGGPDVGAALARLPFDHLLFTGATWGCTTSETTSPKNSSCSRARPRAE